MGDAHERYEPVPLPEPLVLGGEQLQVVTHHDMLVVRVVDGARLAGRAK